MRPAHVAVIVAYADSILAHARWRHVTGHCFVLKTCRSCQGTLVPLVVELATSAAVIIHCSRG
jgi:hypothetical protein